MGTRATSLVKLEPPRQGMVRWLAGWLSLFWRAHQARRELARRARVEWLRRTVIYGALTRRSPEQITAALARTMYALELEAGADDADIGLFGPRLFRREARAFLVEFLRDL
jgi:hypothetical protein